MHYSKDKNLYFRRHFREQLKMQMSDKDHNKRTEQQEKVRESDRAIAYDRECRMNDANEYYRKHNYLMQFRDGNKNVSFSDQNLSLCMRKPTIWVYYQVRHKPVCTVIEEGQKLETLDISRRGIVLSVWQKQRR